MIRLIIGVALFMIPSILLGSIIIKIFPHISQSAVIAICLLTIVGGLLKYISHKKRFYIDSDQADAIPAWMNKKLYVILLAIGTLVGSLAAYGISRSVLYIDNGSDKPVKVQLKNMGSFTIPAKDYTSIKIPKGSNDELEYNNKKRTLNFGDGKLYLFNIDTLNTYIKTSVSYSSEATLYKNGKRSEPEDEDNDPSYKIIREEFFEPNVDYMFSSPEKITIKRSRLSTKSDVSKTVLLRLTTDGLSDKENKDQPENGYKDY